jgi:hypothetical protein
MLIDRFGPRRVLLASAVLLPFLVAALSTIDGHMERYYLIVGLTDSASVFRSPASASPMSCCRRRSR